MRMARLCICNLWSPLQSSENQSSSCACCKLLSFAETHPLANRQQCALERIGAGKQNRFQGEVLQKSWQDLPMVNVVFFSPIISHVVGGTFNWCIAVLNFGGSFSQSAWLSLLAIQKFQCPVSVIISRVPEVRKCSRFPKQLYKHWVLQYVLRAVFNFCCLTVAVNLVWAKSV